MRTERVTDSVQPDLLAELKELELGFHYPASGKTKADFKALMDDQFWEVGASGRAYGKAFVVECLLKRSQDSCAVETRDFNCIEICAGSYLLTYIQIEPGRTTRRAAIWRRRGGAWKNLYHQGTVVSA